MELQTGKFHPLCFEIGVAFETTLPSDKPPVYSTDFAFPDLVYSKPNESVVRVYCPAEISAGDKGEKEISFVPWISNEEDSLFHRVCFRLRPTSRSSNMSRSLSFARFGEEKAFGFQPLRNGASFITLDFLGFQQTFIPLFLKIKNNNSLDEYYKISIEAGEEKVVLTLKRVEETTVPTHLQQKRL